MFQRTWEGDSSLQLEEVVEGVRGRTLSSSLEGITPPQHQKEEVVVGEPLEGDQGEEYCRGEAREEEEAEGVAEGKQTRDGHPRGENSGDRRRKRLT